MSFALPARGLFNASNKVVNATALALLADTEVLPGAVRGYRVHNTTAGAVVAFGPPGLASGAPGGYQLNGVGAIDIPCAGPVFALALSGGPATLNVTVLYG